MFSSYRFDDVETHRKASQPLTKGIAPTLTADMFKSPRCFKKPKSKNFEHLLSIESKSRQPATLKASGAFLRADTISLGTGRPSAQYFPFVGLSIEFPKGPEFFGRSSKDTVRLSTEKYDTLDGQGSLDLAVSLNYGYSAGSEQLVRFLTEHIDIIHNPPYSDWQVSLTAGNTSALDGALRMFCARGDYVLMEEYTYSGATEAMQPLGLRPVGIKLDKHGLIPECLDCVLSGWNEAERGGKKPFLLYMIPTGHNPSGVTQPFGRRKEIYAVAEKHGLYIIEDDPYYFLQLKEPEIGETKGHTTFLASLIPSYLSIDHSGRVLRLDSTSKIIAPGLRCGWMTGSSHLIGRFLYHHDVSTVSPSGLSQLALYKLLDEAWGHGGFMDWLICLRTEYSYRRDVLIQACHKYLPPKICSWNVPSSGMFHWIEIAWKTHPVPMSKKCNLSSADLIIVEDMIFETALKYGVMCCKGSTFCTVGSNNSTRMFFRTTFATATPKQLEEALKRFGQAIKDEFAA